MPNESCVPIFKYACIISDNPIFYSYFQSQQSLFQSVQLVHDYNDMRRIVVSKLFYIKTHDADA